MVGAATDSGGDAMSNKPCRKHLTMDCPCKRGGQSRAKQFTREFQQSARAHVSRDNLVRNGKKSFAIMVERKGFMWAAEVAANYRRAHPSSIQLRVREWLSELGEYFIEDVHLKHGVFPDFNLPTRSLIVEVDGDGFHGDTAHTDWLGDNRAEREPLRERVMRDEGYRVLHLCERCVRDGSARLMLAAFIQAYPQPRNEEHEREQ